MLLPLKMLNKSLVLGKHPLNLISTLTPIIWRGIRGNQVGGRKGTLRSSSQFACFLKSNAAMFSSRFQA